MQTWRYICLVVREQRTLFIGLIWIHVLVHVSHEPIYCLAMMDELKHHGYRIGPGTLYPLLHGLEKSGLLESTIKEVGRRKRRMYTITAIGRKALSETRIKVDELHDVIHESHPRRTSRKSEL
ncbi:MAG: PadR family transcriptional regulator [Terracidiphilus sp.]